MPALSYAWAHDLLDLLDGMISPEDVEKWMLIFPEARGDQEGDDDGDPAAAEFAAFASLAITDFVVISIPFCQGRAIRFHLNA